jgi:hypothetical protein
MTLRTVLGPGGYPRPPYGSFSGKSGATGRQFTQVFTVLGPLGVSRPPQSFAGKVPTVTAKKAGWFPEWGEEKRWWEELQEEYREAYAKANPDKLPSRAKRAVKVRDEIQRLAEKAVVGGLLSLLDAPKVAELVVKTEYAESAVEAIKRADETRKYIEKLIRDREDEDDIEMLVMAL